MDRNRVIKKLVRAATIAMKQPELSTPRTDGTIRRSRSLSTPHWTLTRAQKDRMKKNRITEIATRKTRAEKNRIVKIETYKTRAEIKAENPVRDGDDELLTGQQACAILSTSSKTLKRLRDKKAIGFITIGAGNYRYYRKRHVEAFIQRREMNARLIPHA